MQPPQGIVQEGDEILRQVARPFQLPAEAARRVVAELNSAADEQYEGCLSVLDLRGRVPRALSITVEHTDIDGITRITEFERGVARLIAHEIDHLHGQLYLDHMRPGVEPIPSRSTAPPARTGPIESPCRTRGLKTIAAPIRYVLD